MAQVLIRQLDEQVVQAQRARARAQRLSLEQSLRADITADQKLLRKLAEPRSGQPAVMDLASLPVA